MNNNNIKLKQKFLKRIHDEEGLNNKYKYLSPLIIRYVDAVLEFIPNVSEQFIDNILDIKIDTKSGESVKFKKLGCQYTRPNLKSLDKSILSLKLYTSNFDYLKNSIKGNNQTFDEQFIFLEDSINWDSNSLLGSKGENKKEYSRQWIYKKTAIHELNHACSHTRQVLYKKDGSTMDYGKVTKEDLKNAILYVENGGLKIYKMTFDSNGEKKSYVSQNLDLLLHEGVTEYLALAIFNKEDFDDFIISDKTREKNTYYSISYQPLYRIVGMLECNYDCLLRNVYFADTISKEKMDKINEIKKDFSSLANIILKISMLDSNSKYKSIEMDSSANELVKNIIRYAKKQQDIALLKSKNEEKLFNKNKDTFINVFSRFLDFDTWSWFITTRIPLLNEEDKKYFINKIQDNFSENTEINTLKNDIKEILNNSKASEKGN